MSIKEAKLNLVIGAATELFLERGINAVSIKDVALAAEIGEATVYRYFSKKQHLVLAAAMRLESDVFAQYFDVSKIQGGYNKLQSFYLGYLRVYEAHPEFYRFISEFDAGMASADLGAYEDALANFYNGYLAAYNEGLADGSVKPVEDVRLFYMTTTHALLGLCKKIAVEGKLLTQDVYGQEEIATLTQIFLQHVCNLRV